MPAGTYDVQIQNGTVKIGNGLLPAIPLTSGTTFTVPIGTAPIAQPIGLTVGDLPISGSGITGTFSVTILGAGVTITPADGSASIDASFYGTLNLTGDVGFGTMSTTCPVGSSGSPVNVHLTTANGSPWDAATGAFSLVDNTFVLPTIHCSQALLDALLPLVLGSTTNIGDNVVTILGSALRQADPVVNPNPTTQSGGGTDAGGGSTTTGGNPNEVTPLSGPAAKKCVVPKLIGKTLKQAKKALKKANCKTGKTKKANSKKRKKGRIVKQRYKAGTKLAAGAKVPLTISKGPKKARKHRSR